MPVVTPDAVAGARLLDLADARWARLAVARPELKPAVELQARLLVLVAQLADTIGRGRLPRLSLPPRYLALKLQRGVPILAGEPIPLPVPAIAPVLLRMLDELAAGGAGEAAQAARDAIVSGPLDAASLLAASVSRDQQAVRQVASHAGVSADLLWLAAEMATSPFANALRSAIFERRAEAPELDAAFTAWNHGYCPACGSWPVAAEVAHGHRVLRCAFCSAAWELNGYACVYCGEAGEAFMTAAPDELRKDRRIEACATCGGYLKTIDLEELSPFPLVAITDLETMDLDVAAMQHNYARPAIRQFQRR